MGLQNVSRRGLLASLGVAAAPAIVRFETIMPVRSLIASPPLIHAVVPDGAILEGGRYMDIVRRAFVPRLYIQAYDNAFFRELALRAGAHP